MRSPGMRQRVKGNLSSEQEFFSSPMNNSEESQDIERMFFKLFSVCLEVVWLIKKKERQSGLFSEILPHQTRTRDISVSLTHYTHAHPDLNKEFSRGPHRPAFTITEPVSVRKSLKRKSWVTNHLQFLFREHGVSVALTLLKN